MDFASNLEPLIREVEDHVASAGWDQPVRLFALVPTASLLSANPELAEELGISAEVPLTSVEQEIEDALELDELLDELEDEDLPPPPPLPPFRVFTDF
jgi:hypothetical protein